MLRTIVGWAVVGVGVVALAAAGLAVGRVVVGGRDVVARRLVAGVAGLAILLWGAQLAGAAGVLRPVPTAAIVAVVAGVVVLGAVALGRRRPASGPDVVGVVGAPASRWVQGSARAGVAVVAVQWVSHAVDALQRGMVHPDTVWYHLPFAARFVQTASLGGLDRIGYPSARWFPLNSQLLHSVGILAFGDDSLSPLLNLAWGAAVLVVAWAAGGAEAGRRWLATLAAAAVLALPILAGTQPGVASSDVAAAALLLAGVALLLRSDDLESAGLVAVAGVALGLAVGTKLTVAAPVAAVVVAVALLLVRDRRFRTVAWFLAGGASTAAFWFGRNWVVGGTPVPWFDVHAGPVRFDRLVPPEAPSLAGSLFDGRAWRVLYVDGLAQGLGRVWPVVLAVAVGGAVAALVGRGRSRLERVCGTAVVVGLVAHVVTPLTGGLSFVYNLRYLAPTLLLGMVLLVRVLPLRWATGGAVGLVGVVVVGATSPHVERTPAWPGSAMLPAVGVVAVVALAWVAWRRRGSGRVVAAAMGLVLVVGAVVAQDRYVQRRYRDAGLATDVVNRYFADVHGARIALTGSEESYPLFGRDLSNVVERPDDATRPFAGDCGAWRRLLARGRYDYVVLTELGFGSQRRPAESFVADDPAATEVVRDGDQVAFRLDGPLDPSAC